MDSTSLTTLLTSLVALSMAVERIIELLKGIVPKLITHAWPGDWEYVRCALLRALSAIAGYIIAREGDMHFLNLSGQFGWLLFGALSSGGSAFWNHLLDIVKAGKIKDEAEAKKAAEIATIA